MQVIEGQLFLRQGSRVPSETVRDAVSWNAKWLQLARSPGAVEQQVNRSGWHLFRLTDQVGKWSVGGSRDAAFRQALQSALAGVPASRNMAELVEVRQTSCLGFFLCQIRMAVRHTQQGMILSLTPNVAMISPASGEGKLPGFTGLTKQAIV
ncbi:hypothetical protein AB4Y89_05860 [Terriglobus sp. 2YAB30_2]|uniref:hypothetical protein n=1 Tax=unclassified Terriglobus TaxID=2628988 RepID=UPI003F94A8C6